MSRFDKEKTMYALESLFFAAVQAVILTGTLAVAAQIVAQI